MRELAPKAVRVVVLVNPTNGPSTESTLRDVQEASRAIGLQIQILNASTGREIEAAFATAHNRADALFVAPDGFFNARRVQLATLATHYRLPAAYPTREVVEIGGLMSYGTDVLDMYRQVGAPRTIASPHTAQPDTRKLLIAAARNRTRDEGQLEIAFPVCTWGHECTPTTNRRTVVSFWARRTLRIHSLCRRASCS